MPVIKSIHHVAIVVEDLEQAVAFWEGMLGLKVTGSRQVPAEAVRIAFLPVGESEIELVQPGTDDSGLADYLKKHGPGMHHICLEVDDIAAMLVELKARGVRLINDQALTGADGRKYAFIHPRSAYGVLVELYEL